MRRLANLALSALAVAGLTALSTRQSGADWESSLVAGGVAGLGGLVQHLRAQPVAHPTSTLQPPR